MKKIFFFTYLLLFNYLNAQNNEDNFHGTISNIDAFHTVVTQQLKNEGTIYLTGGNIVNVNHYYEIPKGITVVIEKGSGFKLNSPPPPPEKNIVFPITLNISGEIKAGLNQIFYGNNENNVETVVGDIVGGKVYPEWFGAITNDGIDDTAAIQKALNMFRISEHYLYVNGGTVVFSPGTYNTCDKLILKTPKVTLLGTANVGSKSTIEYRPVTSKLIKNLYDQLNISYDTDYIKYESDVVTTNTPIFNNNLDQDVITDNDANSYKVVRKKYESDLIKYQNYLIEYNNYFKLHKVEPDQSFIDSYIIKLEAYRTQLSKFIRKSDFDTLSPESQTEFRWEPIEPIKPIEPIHLNTGSASIVPFVKETDFTPTILLVDAGETFINGIKFYDVTTEYPSIGIEFNRTADSPLAGDIDSRVINCVFSGLLAQSNNTCISAYGRNLKIFQNTFSGYITGIDLHIHDGTYDNCDNETYGNCKSHGFRGFEIIENRFHAGAIGIQNIGDDAELLHGCRITNNTYDTHGSLFYGSLSESIISDNLIHRLRTNSIHESEAGTNSGLAFKDAKTLVINNNYISGEKDENNSCTAFKTSKYGIYFEKTAEDCLINGNSFANIASNAIYFAFGGNDITISDNSFRKFDTAVASIENLRFTAIEIYHPWQNSLSDNFIIANNKIIGCRKENDQYIAKGIKINAVIENIMISDNIFKNLNSGIYFTKIANECSINNNQFSNIEEDALYFSTGASNTQIQTNTFRKSKNGISLNAKTYNSIISNNLFYDITEIPLIFNNGLSNVQVQSNNFRYSGIAGIKINGSSTEWAIRAHITSNSFVTPSNLTQYGIIYNTTLDNHIMDNNLFNFDSTRWYFHDNN